MCLIKWFIIIVEYINILYIKFCIQNLSMDRDLDRITPEEFQEDISIYYKDLDESRTKIRRLKKI